MAEQQPSLAGMPGLQRSVRLPEFEGITFHEVYARTVLNSVPERGALPFRWTVNPYRGCTHGCTYCFARRSHEYLEFDSGKDFDTQVVVKVNAPEVLAGQLRRGLRTGRWAREHVAMGTNTDPYQRAEGRYRLMPGIIEALTESGTPFSILTKGTVLARDIPLLAEAARTVRVSTAVSLALLDRETQARLEPGTPSPAARLRLIRKLREAGLPCSVMVAPVLPRLTDSAEQLDALLAELAEAGASGVTVLPLHLRPGAREWFATWLGERYPELIESYRDLYGKGSYVRADYRRMLHERVAPLLRKYGFAAEETARTAGSPEDSVSVPEAGRPSPMEQLSLL